MSLESSTGDVVSEKVAASARPHHDDDKEKATSSPEHPKRDPPDQFESEAPNNGQHQQSVNDTKLNNPEGDDESSAQNGKDGSAFLPTFKAQVREDQARGVVAGRPMQRMVDREYPNFKDQVREQQDRGVVAGEKGRTTHHIMDEALATKGPNFKDQMRVANRREKDARGAQDAYRLSSGARWRRSLTSLRETWFAGNAPSRGHPCWWWAVF